MWLPNTGGSGYSSFTRYFYAQQDKEGAVVDERYNHGGMVADYIVNELDRRPMGYFATRDGRTSTTPIAGIFGPKVMLINESAGSGGDALPYMFHQRQLGPLVGTRTWGGLVGTLGVPQTIDGGGITAPGLAFYDLQDKWAVENEGIAPDVRRRTEAAAEALAAAGAKVDEASVPAATYGLSAYYLIAPAEASSNLARYDGVRYGLRVDAANTAEMNIATRSAGFGDEVKRRIMLGTYALSAGYYDAYYGKAQQVRTLIIRDFQAAYEQFDVLLSPTSPTTAFELGAKTADPLSMYMNDVCTIPSNLSGDPSMSVPYGTGDDGLPVGVQVLAPALGERVMFRAAAALERSLS